MKWWEIKFSDDPAWDELGWLRLLVAVLGFGLALAAAWVWYS